jgi:WD40 repeat protein
MTVRYIEFLDSTTVVSKSADSTLRIWNLSTGNGTAILRQHTGTVRCIAVTPNFIISAGQDGILHVWNRSNNGLMHKMTGLGVGAGWVFYGY